VDVIDRDDRRALDPHEQARSSRASRSRLGSQPMAPRSHEQLIGSSSSFRRPDRSSLHDLTEGQATPPELAFTNAVVIFRRQHRRGRLARGRALCE
jgi:hypothetical protein